MMKINEEVTLENVIGKVATMMVSDYRFVTMTAVDFDEYFYIYYHFDKNYELYTMRLKVEKPGVVPSISKACFAALIVENEIQDLFGITFTGLVVDYEKHFLLAPDAPEKPFCHVPGVKITTVDSPAAKKDEVAK